jgi:hypothetical protein
MSFIWDLHLLFVGTWCDNPCYPCSEIGELRALHEVEEVRDGMEAALYF